MAPPSPRQAFFQTRRGLPEQVIQYDAESLVPVLEANDVLVKVSHVSLNPLGYKLMTLLPGLIHKMPALLENDFSGTIVDSNGHIEWPVGEPVFGTVSVDEFIKKGRGALSTYIVVSVNDIFPRPSSISYEVAATFPMVGLTAYLALTQSSQVKAGDRVFINGGSTAVGMVATQLAKARGAYVAVSCSAASLELVKSLGADATFDYRSEPLSTQLASPSVEPFDVFFDTIGLISLYTNSEAYLKRDGVFVAISADNGGDNSILGNVKALLGRALATSRPRMLGGPNRKFEALTASWNEEGLRTITEMVADGRMKLPIDSRYPFTEAGVKEAYARSMSGRAKGKIVIELPQ